MELRDRVCALYGRFTPGVREQVQKAIVQGGGVVARDLTQRSHLLVIGGLAASLIDTGALAARIQSARERGVPILGERGFLDQLDGVHAKPASTLPLATALAKTSLSAEDADLLAAFDLVALSGDSCRFGDRAAFKAADELLVQGRSRADMVRILSRARDLAPVGRHKIVLTANGEAALQWDHGLTSLEGQGLFAFDDEHPTLDDLFESATLAEAEGDLKTAAQLFDQCARADRSDPIAPYNHANIELARGDPAHAVLGYQRALSRDQGFGEARYNLAQALEQLGKSAEAAKELERLLKDEPTHSDALFNLAQLRLSEERLASAQALFERYLELDPPQEWADKARRAVIYCSTQSARA